MNDLKNKEFWQHMDHITETIDRWPDWMKGSSENKRATEPDRDSTQLRMVAIVDDRRLG